MNLFENEEISKLKEEMSDVIKRLEILEGRKQKADQGEKIPFETFWNKYNKKVDRLKCEKLWNKLSITDQKLTLKHLEYYVPQTEIQYRKNPQTYLNGQCWNDEIIMEEKQQQKFTYNEMLTDTKEMSIDGRNNYFNKFDTIKENGVTYWVKKCV